MIAVTAIPEGAVRRTLASTLEAAGWRTRHGLNADDVLARCREPGVDAVFVDAHFPGGPAALVAQLKSDLELFQIAVVLVTDTLAVAEVEALLRSGFADVLRKPADPAEALARATAAARLTGLVSQLTEQQQHLEALVFFDELTGVRNRRAVLSDLEQLVAAARRHPHTLSVVMIDLDRFKQINDEHGHLVGDEVLCEVTRRIGSRLRTEDVLGRLGGDELLVLLPDTDLAGASVLAEAVRDGVGHAPVATEAGPVPVTLSLGTACWDDETVAELIERADQALLRAKGAGRDQAVAAG